MYQKIKDCIIAPSRIPNHLNESAGKHWLYFFILLIIYCLGPIISFSVDNTIDEELSNALVETMREVDLISYKLENGHLISTDGHDSLDVGRLDVNTGYDNFTVLFGFTTDPNKNFIGACEETQFFGVTFLESELRVGLYVKTGEGLDGIEQNIAYSSLGLSNCDFSRAKDAGYDFSNAFNLLLINAYKSFKNSFAPLIIVVMIFALTLTYLFSIGFIALLEWLVYKRVGIKFKDAFKITMYSSTLFALANVLVSVTGIDGFSLIGEIVMLVYTIKAIFSFRVRTIITERSHEQQIFPGIFMKTVMKDPTETPTTPEENTSDNTDDDNDFDNNVENEDNNDEL